MFVIWPALGLLIFTGFYFSVVKLRAHFRYVQALEQDVGKFVADDSTSYCCSVGHVSPDGGLLTCDRLIILQCISAWFGSVENFEALVRTDFFTREVFTYKQIAVSAMPILWHYMDSAATIHFYYFEGIDGSNGRPLFGTLRNFRQRSSIGLWRGARGRWYRRQAFISAATQTCLGPLRYTGQALHHICCLPLRL